MGTKDAHERPTESAPVGLSGRGDRRSRARGRRTGNGTVGNCGCSARLSHPFLQVRDPTSRQVRPDARRRDGSIQDHLPIYGMERIRSVLEGLEPDPCGDRMRTGPIFDGVRQRRQYAQGCALDAGPEPSVPYVKAISSVMRVWTQALRNWPPSSAWTQSPPLSLWFVMGRQLDVLRRSAHPAPVATASGLREASIAFLAHGRG